MEPLSSGIVYICRIYAKTIALDLGCSANCGVPASIKTYSLAGENELFAPAPKFYPALLDLPT